MVSPTREEDTPSQRCWPEGDAQRGTIYRGGAQNPNDEAPTDGESRGKAPQDTRISWGGGTTGWCGKNYNRGRRDDGGGGKEEDRRLEPKWQQATSMIRRDDERMMMLTN